MDFKKTVPVAIIVSLIAGVGFAHGSTFLTSKTTTPEKQAATENTELKADSLDIKNEITKLTERLKTLDANKTSNPDRTADIAALKAEISKLRARLTALESQKSPNPDRTTDIAALKAKISKLRARLTALNSQKSSNPDRTADIASVKRRIFMLKNRLKALRAENSMDNDRADRESPEASMHHDGDDHHPELGRSAFGHDMHEEATREIMHGSHERIAALYSPSHHAGYHARMHRHSR